VYGYKINRSGLRSFMTTDARLKGAITAAANTGLTIARSLVPVDTSNLRESGRVEDLGIQRVVSGESRMTVAVVFGGNDAGYAGIVQGRTGFLTGAIGRWL
jgi:hypothetical protein